MKFLRFRKKEPLVDPLEERLDVISDLTRGLGKKEFNNLMNAVKSVFNARQQLRGVKTDDEKETGDIDECERKLEKEVQK